MSKIPKKVQEIRDFVAKAETGAKNVSFSQLSTYLSCPLCWSRAYIKKEAPYVPSIHTVFGTAFHETVQHWLDLLYNTSVKASEEFDGDKYLLGKLRTIYSTEKEKTGFNFSTAEELNSFYEDGKAIFSYIKKNRKVYFSSKHTHLVGCEIPLLYKLGPKFYFKGFIDVLLYDSNLDRWKIIDIKTSTSGWNATTKGNFIKTSQVLLYKKYLAEMFGLDIEKIDVEYFIVKRKVPEDPIYPVMSRRVQEFAPSCGSRSVKKAVALVENFIVDTLTEDGEYQDKEYTANASKDSCKWCVFKDSCKVAIK